MLYRTVQELHLARNHFRHQNGCAGEICSDTSTPGTTPRRIQHDLGVLATAQHTWGAELNVIGRLLALNLRENLQHKVRGIVGIAVVAVSIALVVAVFATYGSITGSVNELSQRIAGSADLEVSGITDTGLHTIATSKGA